MISCSNLFHTRGLLGSVIIYACFSDNGLMCTKTAMCESGHCRDKVWLFCLHLSVMLLVVILSHLITKRIIVMNTKKMNCLTNFPNKHFSFSIVRCQLMWSLKSKLCKSFRGSISCPFLPIYFTPLTCFFNVFFFPLFKPPQNSPLKSFFSLASYTSCLALFHVSLRPIWVQSLQLLVFLLYLLHHLHFLFFPFLSLLFSSVCSISSSFFRMESFLY